MIYLRPIKINVSMPVKGIIVEKWIEFEMDGRKYRVIGANSRLYCGACGGILTEVGNAIMLPCSQHAMVRNFKPNSEVIIVFHTPLSAHLQHQSCMNTLFTSYEMWKFYSVHDMIKAQNQHRQQLKDLNK